VFYYHPDYLRSTSSVTNSVGTEVRAEINFPYGRARAAGGTKVVAHGYTGQERDTTTGLYYYGARYYDPAAMRFISADSIIPDMADPQTYNHYAYVRGNPIKYTDPTGHYIVADDVVFAVGGAIIGVAARGAVDLFTGKVSSWQDYTGAAVGGAVGGWATLYTGPIAGGALAGASGNATTQALKIMSGEQRGVDWGGYAVDVGVSAISGGLLKGAPIAGINVGRNSYNAIFEQIMTKANNNTISSISTGTAFKMFAGKAWDDDFFSSGVLGSLYSDVWDSYSDLYSAPSSSDYYGGLYDSSGGGVLTIDITCDASCYDDTYYYDDYYDYDSGGGYLTIE
jgi:type VI secretion system secreted protein VgrG